MRARSALFTLFGDVVLPSGGEAWLRDITAAMATVEVNAAAVRTALHRMAVEGWVEPRREGRFAAYQLTDRGEHRLRDAANRIYRLRSARWDGRWHLLASQALASRAEVVAELEWVGFGRLQPGLWVSPHDHAELVGRVLEGVEPAPILFSRAGSSEDATIAGRAWDLDGLRGQHVAFLERWRDLPAPADDEAAFRLRLQLVHQWRKFLFEDPGLPDEVLPEGWEGHEAARVFKDTYEQLLEPSWRWWAALRAEGDALELDGRNPFARGLAAIGSPATADAWGRGGPAGRQRLSS